jgi:Fe2+ transport system protein FeoA
MMRLSELETDVQARISEIQTAPDVIERLYSVGIFVGSLVQKTRTSDIGSPVCIWTSHDCTFALGYGLAEKIIITRE